MIMIELLKQEDLSLLNMLISSYNIDFTFIKTFDYYLICDLSKICD